LVTDRDLKRKQVSSLICSEPQNSWAVCFTAPFETFAFQKQHNLLMFSARNNDKY